MSRSPLEKRARLHRDIQVALDRATVNLDEFDTAVWPALLRAAKDLDPWTPEQNEAFFHWRASLSAVQRRYLDLRARGMKYPQIAAQVGTSEAAVLNTLTAIFAEGASLRPLPTYPVSDSSVAK